MDLTGRLCKFLKGFWRAFYAIRSILTPFGSDEIGKKIDLFYKQINKEHRFIGERKHIPTCFASKENQNR